MKKTLILCFLSISVCAFGQESKKFKFGFSINAGMSDNILTMKKDTNFLVDIAEMWREIEKPSLAYAVNFLSEYNINAASKLRIGLGFSQTGNRTDKIEIGNSVSDSTMPVSMQTFWIQQNIAIPIHYKQYLPKKLRKFYLIGGLTPLVVIRNPIKNKLWFADGSLKKQISFDNSSNIKMVNVNLFMGIGYDLKISDKLTLFIQPSFDCQILGQSSFQPINRRMYSAGLTLGTLIN